ncbi:MAG: hypothetical protein WHX60_15775 [Armatimonadota bacterium]
MPVRRGWTIGVCLWLAVSAVAQPRFERMAALHQSVVSIHEASGIAGLFTYDHDPAYWLEYLALGKLLVGVRQSESVRWLHEARDLKVRNIPSGEGVEATGTVAGKRVNLEVLPTARGRDTQRWEGSALFIVTCQPKGRLVLRYGGIGRVRIHAFRPQLPSRLDYLTQPDFLPSPAQSVEVSASGAVLSSEQIPLRVAVRFASDSPGRAKNDLPFVRYETAGEVERVSVLAGFAEDSAMAQSLASENHRTVERLCRQRFRQLTSSAWVRTPSPAINEAFRWAIIHMEYAWVRPYGWIEGLRHWGTFYSQQHNMAADWIGQANRSQEMLLTHAQHLLPNGQVPQMHPNGQTRLDFGGWNQFYVWGVEHYWLHTGDRDFLQRILNPLQRVVNQTFEEHDPDGNGLLGFGQQIGNQEDYISTPEDGTSPTVAGMEMLRILSRMLRASGREAEAEQYMQKWSQMRDALFQHLWVPELGRFAFYRDRLGVLHLEGQYHTLVWPVIYGILPPAESYLSLRHLADTLTGKEGQIYCSNNFPRHVTATVGSQAGGQQQPWATLAWAKMGDGDRAVRPLEWIARLVTQPYCSGSWPEVGDERVPAYFTPPAGVFVWGVIEGLFGLKRDVVAGELEVAPCMPGWWKYMELHLPDLHVAVRRDGSRLRVVVHQQKPLRLAFRVHVPPNRGVWAKIDGKPVTINPYEEEPAVKGVWVRFKSGRRNHSELTISWKPLPIEAGAWKRMHTGQLFNMWLYDPVAGVSHHGGSGVEFGKRVVDLQNILQEEPWQSDDEGFYSWVKRSLSVDPDEYGRVGERVLSRRTVFVRCYVQAGDRTREFLMPADFSLFSSHRFWNAELRQAGGQWQVHADLEDTQVERVLAQSDLARLTPGINTLEFVRKESSLPVRLRFDARPLFEQADWQALARSCVRHVNLPEELLSPDTEWRRWRIWWAYGHPPWSGLRPPLEAVGESPLLEPPCVPGVSFLNPERRMIVVSRHLDRPLVTLPLSGKGRKVYLLVVPLLDNHDVFAPVARVSVGCGDGAFFSRELHFPGDLDWWAPPRIVGDFATYGSDWQALLSWETPSAVLNVVEIDLGQEHALASLTIETVGRYPAIGVVGVSVWGSPARDSVERLPETVRKMLRHQPRTLFDFNTPSLEGWEISGTAWGIADTAGDPWGRRGSSRYFANSMAGGEQATGSILSPPFRVSGAKLTFLSNGHGARNYFALVDARTGEELRRAPAPNKTGAFVKNEWDVSDLRGREMRFKAVDAEDGTAYAWIGFDDIVEVP